MILPPEILARLSEEDLQMLEAATAEIAQTMNHSVRLGEELESFVASLVEKYQATKTENYDDQTDQTEA